MYNWHKLSDSQRAEVERFRVASGLAWHSPPHFAHDHTCMFHLTAACYEHAPIIGSSPKRMSAFSSSLQATLTMDDRQLLACASSPITGIL